MKYSWGDIEIISIQKMFLNNQGISVDDLESMKNDRVYRTYLNAMPSAANEGIQLLMRVGEPLIKTYEFTQNIPETILNEMNKETIQIVDSDYIKELNNAKAYYFEVDGSCTVLIQKYTNNSWSTIETLSCTPKTNTYKEYKGFIANDNEDIIRLVFKKGYIYNARNIALYGISFRKVEDIYDNKGKQEYTLNKKIPDLYEISSVEFEPYSNNYGVFINNYVMNGDNVFIVDSELRGNFIIKYIAYPDKITSETDVEYTFKMPSDMVSLLPLYIASELYKDDDLSLATMYRNEFEAGLQKISKRQTGLKFTSITGWV